MSPLLAARRHLRAVFLIPLAGGVALALAASILPGCSGPTPEPGALSTARPSLLLVTFDTTRADSMGPDALGLETPAFNALAAAGRRFRQAYATAPETLPSHSSIMTGLYPAGHGVHENARFLSGQHAVIAARLADAGYETAAFVSSFVLNRRFGLARGFSTYDDSFPSGASERSSKDTTDRALAFLGQPRTRPLFLWVHYFDAHAPYDPPEPFRTRFRTTPYKGEIAAMDEELGRLLRGFDEHAAAPRAVVATSDHGEGLGDHGESQHGLLAYQSTMLVPLVISGPGVSAGMSDVPVSTRRVFHTLLDWAGLGATNSLRGDTTEIVLGEAMKPFLSFGWQPQVIAVSGSRKAILTGSVELYDLRSDPGETRDLSRESTLSPDVRALAEDYPLPSSEAARAPDALTAEERARLASLGYVNAGSAPVVRRGAPRPVDMAHLFDVVERASGLFVAARYAEVIPLLQEILRNDPYNLDAVLRLATSHSSLGQAAQAEAAFRRAAALAPRSLDVPAYLGLHYARGADWARAAPLFERVLAGGPERVPVLEALAVIRVRQRRLNEAADLLVRVYALRPPSPAESTALGQLAMQVGRTPLAIESFERARSAAGQAFQGDLDLGAVYLAVRRFADARDAFDRALSREPRLPMALFKRAQVSVLLQEPDRAARIARARDHADATTRPLIARETLFR